MSFAIHAAAVSVLLAAAVLASDASWVTPPVTAERVVYRTLTSSVIGADVSLHIYVPRGYESNARRFPVLYWLHGSGGGLPGIKPLAMRYDRAIADGSIAPMIIVFPNGKPYSMWCDATSGVSPVESMFIKEIIPFIDAEYRTIPERQGRIIEGFSMGGYGAARYGLLYTNMFAAISMLGAGPLQLNFLEEPPGGGSISRENRLSIYRSVYGGDMDVFRDQSPWFIAMRRASYLKGIRLRIAIGRRDATFDANEAFSAHIARLGIVHEFTAPKDVGHDTMALLNAMGDGYWEFYRRVFGKGER